MDRTDRPGRSSLVDAGVRNGGCGQASRVTGWGVVVDGVIAMRSNGVRTWGLMAIGVIVAGPSVKSAERDDARMVNRTSMRILSEAPTGAVAGSTSPTASAVAIPLGIGADIRRLPGFGGVAAPPPGSTQVYKNESSDPSFYAPGANQRIADDLHLANGACDAVYYSLVVYGPASVGGTFTVHTELWTGDPCVAGSTAIAGTAADSPPVPADGNGYPLEATINPAAPVPATVWLAATFSRNDVGWLVAGQAEIGSTVNSFSEDDDANLCQPTNSCQSNANCATGRICVGGVCINCPQGYSCQGGVCQLCTIFNFGGQTPPHAGFWASLNCNIAAPPNGACCNGTSCTQTTQANCPSPRVWQGAFTTCQPNACQPGACCDDVDFETCTDTNAALCPTGLFKPGTTCAANACGPNFEVYENSFLTGIFVGVDANRKWGDDLTLGAGAPCQLTAYELLMAGDGTAPNPATFSAHVELWANNDHGTPTVDTDDTPLAVIPGTARDTNGLAADLTLQRLLVGPFTGIQLPRKVWMVVTTSSDNAGPIFGGLANIGFSQDGFAEFNDPSAPNAWTAAVFQFPPTGFNPTNCPFDPQNPTCVPAGSFRARVWCAGVPPTGACCNDVSGTCSDGVLSTACEGRWMQNVTCASNPFIPPCGVHACCFPNPINPSSVVCADVTPEGPEGCASLEGSSAPGLFCANVTTCPIRACIDKPGGCFVPHATGGCENAFCCDKVCAADPFCCTSDWDSTCVGKARTLCSSDQCNDALPIAGAGTFNFDTTAATTDGPAHAACVNIGGDEQIVKDVWYCWTAPCTDTVYVRTCGQTELDTKLAAYDGCACPPSDANLLDCGDDRCGQGHPQSTAVFHAVAGRSYLIRLGAFPGALPDRGTGTFTISCDPPAQPNCPATGDCCGALGTTGCVNQSCCEAVCGCDSFCCDRVWDADCAGVGFQGSGCGADVLCPVLCGDCPAGTVTFVDPLPGILDAGRPFPPDDAAHLLGIDTIHVTAPAGSNVIGCWKLCETASSGVANGIAGITDDGGGQFTIKLGRPITAGAVTKITYAGNGTAAGYIAHPANLNADGAANTADVTALANALNGTAPLPGGVLSGDVDRSGAVTAADILDAVGLLNGEGAYVIWNNTARPAPNVNCP